MFKKTQRGYTFTEVLGTLAVTSMITMGGIKLFSSAMNKHQANEIINEAQKRATSVAAQIMAGKDKNDLSVAEFPETEGYTFGVQANPQNPHQFNITITGVDAAVCNQIRNFTSDNTSIRSVSDNCGVFTFNDDLSKTAYASDNQTETDCDQAGYTWCSGSDNATGRCSESSDCCTGLEYDTQCRACNSSTGEITDVPYGITCDYNRDGKNESTCYKGVCPSPTNIDRPCLDNSDCGGPGSGYYCYINTSSVDETMDFHETVGCAGKNVLECDPDNYYFRRVTMCVPLTDKKEATIPGLGTVFMPLKSSPGVYFWPRRYWCQAHGGDMLTLADLKIYRSEPGDSGYNNTYSAYGKTLYTQGGGRQEAIYACAEGKTCGSWNQAPYNAMWNGNTLTDAKDENGELYSAKFSPIVVALRQAFGGTTVYLRTDSGITTKPHSVLVLNLGSGMVYPMLYSGQGGSLCK